MLTTGYITAGDKTYEWCVRHYRKKNWYNINFGRVEWVAIADESGLLYWISSHSSYYEMPQGGVVADIVNALIERFEWEGEEYEKSIRENGNRTSDDVGLCVLLHGVDGCNRG